jgi:hypothetical protein
MKKTLAKKPRSAAAILTGVLLLFAVSAHAAPEPIKSYPELDYINVTQALLKLGKFKPDNDDYLDAYSMAVHCDVVQGSYRDEFRWKQAREAMKKYIAQKRDHLPTRLGVRSQILFTRYDFDSKYFLFSPETSLNRVNTFTTNPRSSSPGCTSEVSKLLPSYYLVVTNNPVNVPGIRMTEDQARDLSQKFTQQQNSRRMAYIRFVIDIVDADAVGPTIFNNKKIGDEKLRVKSTLHSIEFFSDPEYTKRFYIFYPY